MLRQKPNMVWILIRLQMLIFQPLSISHSVNRMVWRAGAWIQTCDHNDFRFHFSYERVSENHCKLGCPERNMITLVIQSSDTFLERQQTFIDFRSLQPPLSVVTLTVSRSLRTSQVDQEEFSILLSVDTNADLTDGMASGRGVIRSSLVSGPDRMTIVDDLLYVWCWICVLLNQPKHLNLVVFILQNLKFIFIVEQIHTLSSINFKKGHVKSDSFFALWDLEDVIDSILCDCRHCESFTRSCLTVGKACHDAIVKQAREKVSDGVLVHVLAVFVLVKGVVKLKVGILDILGDAVYFVLGLVHHRLWVGSRHWVNLTHLKLFVEQWSFPDTNADIHWTGTHMVQSLAYLLLMLIN